MRDARGFGLIEVIVVVAIISIVALGIATMMQDMFSQQKKASQRNALNSTKARLIEILQSPRGWELTVGHSSNDTYLGCLRVGGTCADGFSSALNIIDSSGASYYPSATATAGFRSDGSTCNTFSTATPDPSCPFRWAFTWTATCPVGTDPCPSPDVRIVGQFSYSAGPTGLGEAFNPANYNIDFRRGAEVIRNERVYFAYRLPGPGVAPEVPAPATCKNNWRTRALNVSDNPNGLDDVSLAGNQFTLPTGSYNCRVLVPGFKNGGNRVRIVRVADSFIAGESAVTNANVNGGSVTSSIETVLRVNSTSTFRIEHFCTADPSDDSDGFGETNPAYSFGYPVQQSPGNYTGAIFTSVNCLRTGS